MMIGVDFSPPHSGNKQYGNQYNKQGGSKIGTAFIVLSYALSLILAGLVVADALG